MEKDGFETHEGSFSDVEPVVRVTLDPSGERPPSMVRVRGGNRRVGGLDVEVPDFYLDQLEVSNREYQEFVDAGGYRERRYWEHPFTGEGRDFTFEEAMALFVDATGRPAPATWELGRYPEGEGSLPVTGVSWYEAAAYAAFRKKSLPTLHHWNLAAGIDYYSDILKLSNFGGKGPVPAGESPGMGPNGTYDMAGNVKEWCFNSTGEKRFILGGAWNEPPYLFRDWDAQDPISRSPTFGFRCARYITPVAEALFGPFEPARRDAESEPRASDEAFELYRSLYAYDRSELNAVVESVDDESEYYRKEKITFDAAYGGERVIAWIFLPKNTSPPFQSVVYYPSGEAFAIPSSDYLGKDWWLELVFRSGRALVHPVYQGTYERRVEGSGPNFHRDLVIQQFKDLARSLDYLESRPDIDRTKIAYYGQSAGAEFAPIPLALEPRFQTGVLLWGGVPERRHASEVIEPVNFLPRVRVPLLMLNGRQDFIFPMTTSQLPFYRLLGTAPGDKRHVLFDYGHIPLRNQDVIREILDWLDHHLGPV
jgi:hypothetical protein